MLKKFVKRVFPLVLAATVVLGGIGVAGANENNPVVVYDHSSGRIHFENAFGFKTNTEPDLFKTMKDMMPGDSATQTIKIKAENIGIGKVDFYLRAENPNDDYQALMDLPEAHKEWVKFQVLDGEEDIADELWDGYDSDYGVALGSFKKNDEKELSVTLDIALEADNRLQDLLAEVDWIFSVVVNPIGDGGSGGGDGGGSSSGGSVSGIGSIGIIGGADVSSVLNTTDHYAYIIGYKDGLLRPYNTLTRGEAATIFFRLLRDEIREEYWSQGNSYRDVDADLWCNNAISTLTNMGIIDGFRDATFKPNETITRAQFAKMAVNFFERTVETYQGYYSDVAENAWFASYVESATRVGLIEGFEDGTFRPDESITRAQACVIVNRVLGRRPHEEHLLPENIMVTWPDCALDDWFYADMMEATNSHDYSWTMLENQEVEQWTGKTQQRDWAALEHAWSKGYGK